MTNDRLPRTSASADLVSYTILVDSQELSPRVHVKSIKVFHGINRIPAATLTVLDGDVAQADFAVSNGEQFLPGKPIEIQMGYHQDEAVVFKGVIVSHQLKVKRNKPSVLVIECRHKAAAMALGRKNRYFEDMSDSDIMEELSGTLDLSNDIDSTNVTHSKMVQYGATDWDFMVTRAEANGKLVNIDMDSLSIKAPDTSQRPVTQLIYGSTIFSFEAMIDARNQSREITSTSWHYQEQDKIEETSTEPEITHPGNVSPNDLSAVFENNTNSQLQHGGNIQNNELKSWADAALVKSRLSQVLGTVICQGIPELKPGKMIELQGVGERFNGNCFVGCVTHLLSEQNWESHVQIGLSPSWFAARMDLADIPASGLLPPVHGLQIGIVTDLEDPDGENRVRVKMPVISTQEEGIWCRMAQLDAGDNRTLFFRPELEDEVVLGFLNNDPRHPVIIGCLHSSSRPSPIDQTNENNEKGIVTRDGLKCLFNDDEKSITIETPDGKKFRLNDQDGEIKVEDENDNTLTMNGDGITLESASDVTIKASGDINLEGTNVTCKATATMSAEGGSGSELKSGATTIIEGTLVQIN